MQMACGDLYRQLTDRIPGEPGREAVKLGCLDIVAILIRLATAEGRGLELPVIDDDACGHDAERDVCRVQPVMRDGCFGEIHSPETMHERGRTERRFTGQARID